METGDDVFNLLADGLAEKGWAFTDILFTSEFLLELVKEETALFNKGEFKQAGVGKGGEHKLVTEIRGDHVHWLDKENLTVFQQIFWDKMEGLKSFLNREFFFGMKEMEFHFAVYPEGSFYKKHIDRFKRDAGRTISCVLYLNQNRKDEDGGQLRIYDGEESHTDITPLFGRFVCFKSDEIYHEVLPTKKERYSITGWMKN